MINGVLQESVHVEVFRETKKLMDTYTRSFEQIEIPIAEPVKRTKIPNLQSL